MSEQAYSVECKLYVQTISDLVEKTQDMLFAVQAVEAPKSGFVLLSVYALQNAVQSLSAAADHLQQAANGKPFP